MIGLLRGPSRSRRAKRDGNHAEIAACYRDAGATFQDLAAVGGGVPDGVVGFRGVTDLVEIKDPAGEDKIYPVQLTWHRSWRGSVVRVVRTRDDVLDHLRAMVARAPLRGIR